MCCLSSRKTHLVYSHLSFFALVGFTLLTTQGRKSTSTNKKFRQYQSEGILTHHVVRLFTQILLRGVKPVITKIMRK